MVEEESSPTEQGEKHDQGKDSFRALFLIPCLEVVIGFAAGLARVPGSQGRMSRCRGTGNNELPLTQRAIHFVAGPRFLDLKLLLAMRTGDEHEELVNCGNLDDPRLARRPFCRTAAFCLHGAADRANLSPQATAAMTTEHPPDRHVYDRAKSLAELYRLVGEVYADRAAV
ncbi:MAG: hypothetical protein ACKO39_00020, partial [Chthoniobacterales bacterium]